MEICNHLYKELYFSGQDFNIEKSFVYKCVTCGKFFTIKHTRPLKKELNK